MNFKTAKVDIENLKELYERLGNYSKVSNFLKQKGFSRGYHPDTINRKIKNSFQSNKDYMKWKNDVKVNELRKYASLNKGEFRGEKYLGRSTPHLFYCNKHKIDFKITPNCLINRDQWCPKCGHEKAGKKQRLKIEDIKKIVEKRGGILISETYGKDQYDPIIIKCDLGHKFRILRKTLKKGAWCDIC